MNEPWTGLLFVENKISLPQCWYIQKTKRENRLLAYVCSGLRTSTSAYLCEIKDVGVGDCEQSVHCTSEGIDLLVGVPHKDLPTWLRQNYVHDSCNQQGEK